MTLRGLERKLITGNPTSPICIHNAHSRQCAGHLTPPRPLCSWWIELVDGLREQPKYTAKSSTMTNAWDYEEVRDSVSYFVWVLLRGRRRGDIANK